jgi:hypothetical protein
MVATNLPGITRPTEMTGGHPVPLVLQIILGVNALENASWDFLLLSDQIPGIGLKK